MWIIQSDFQMGSNIIRQIGGEKGIGLPSQKHVLSSLEVPEYDTAPFGCKWYGNWTKLGDRSFRGVLEGWALGNHTGLHNEIHRWIGGTMSSPPNSIQDPVFILHHVQVDRLFTKWQEKQQCFASECYRPRPRDLYASIPGVVLRNGSYRLEGHMMEDEIFPWKFTAQDVWGTSGLLAEYEYVDPGTVRRPSPLQVIGPSNNNPSPQVGNSRSQGTSTFNSNVPLILSALCILLCML
jgi:hypothetical protein